MQITISPERLEEIKKERKKRLLSLEELEAMFGCSAKTIKRHVTLFGFPKGVQLPGGRFWDLDDIHKYVKSQKKIGRG